MATRPLKKLTSGTKKLTSGTKKLTSKRKKLTSKNLSQTRHVRNVSFWGNILLTRTRTRACIRARALRPGIGTKNSHFSHVEPERVSEKLFYVSFLVSDVSFLQEAA